jgi:hypothetical protein
VRSTVHIPGGLAGTRWPTVVFIHLPPADPGLIHLTVAEANAWSTCSPATGTAWNTTLHWHTWRRRHQARSRWLHQRKRLTRQ